MKPMPLRKYIELYEKKTKDKFVARDDYVLFFLPERGFMTCKIDPEGKMLIVEFVCGDIHFWRDFAELKCRELGLNIIGTFCNRNIYAYLKNFGAEILEEQNVNNQKRLLCQDNIGRQTTVTFMADRREGLEPEYMVCQYLNRKAVNTWEEFMKGDE